MRDFLIGFALCCIAVLAMAQVSINSNGQDPSMPAGAIFVSGNATGTTGAVVGTIASASGKTNYLCGVAISAIGGTAAVGPITIAGLVGSPYVYELASSAGGAFLAQTFRPCLPSGLNTNITTTTTADGTASNVSVISWGYQR